MSLDPVAVGARASWGVVPDAVVGPVPTESVRECLEHTAARAGKEATPLGPAADPVVPAGPARRTAGTLGSTAFREEYGVRYAYAAGGMHGGIGPPGLVVRLARAGILSFLGTGGLTRTQIAAALRTLGDRLGPAAPFGVNLTHRPFDPTAEDDVVDAALHAGVRFLEASAYVRITPALVRYRLRGARVLADGRAHAPRKLLAKVTRPDGARLFLGPAPARLVTRLRTEGAITAGEAAAAPLLPMADDLCATGDAGGYTDMGVLPALLPSVIRLRDRFARAFPAAGRVRVGGGGGIGTPEAAAAAFVLGADFVLTGSVNLCTVESGISARAKDLLQGLDVHDTTYAPHGDLFELGGRARVVKKGVLFPARADRLYDLWRLHPSWEAVAPAVRRDVEERYFRDTFDAVYARLRAAAPGAPEPDAKRRMALVFRWYCDGALRLAVAGEAGREVDFQIPCGPALGACNQWLRTTGLGAWQDRHADEVARAMLEGAAPAVGPSAR
ncbi:PfaD family polyunsaturated fatty acid/polyketide biosynthesis protein [Streptomyces netropsis]|nr:PfaD family polyunsaturated fatty acid/polyketide biosynthesis protein [Streptomyces netropsis]GGR23375.1 hypothetical protein GCM10010219_30120 [Streptomyces netropsis]